MSDFVGGPDDAVVQRIGPWLVTFEWPDGAAQGGPQRLIVTPAPDGDPQDIARGLSSTVLRKVDFGSAFDVWRQSLSPDELQTHFVVRVKVRAVEDLQRHAAGGITDDYLARLAGQYVHLVNQGESRVTAKLAEMVGKQPETIRAHLKEARLRGLLTAVKGKAGGQLTDRAAMVITGKASGSASS